MENELAEKLKGIGAKIAHKLEQNPGPFALFVDKTGITKLAVVAAVGERRAEGEEPLGVVTVTVSEFVNGPEGAVEIIHIRMIVREDDLNEVEVSYNSTELTPLVYAAESAVALTELLKDEFTVKFYPDHAHSIEDEEVVGMGREAMQITVGNIMYRMRQQAMRTLHDFAEQLNHEIEKDRGEDDDDDTEGGANGKTLN